jgi:predicted Zn-dependent protease
MGTRHRCVVTVATLMLGTLAACATNPATGQRQLMLMSEAEEIQLGREADQQVRREMGVYQDADLQRYVSEVGQRLARGSERPNLPWAYTVVDAQAVNAFALPGGFIYITRGILPFLRDESELAAVLAHETGHVTARHSAAAYSRQVALGGGLGILGVFVPQTRPLQGLAGVGLQLLFLRNSREAELEADQLGTRYASSDGWDPQGMPDLLGTLGRLDQASGTSRGVPNWALTHPPAEDRIARVQEAVAAARALGGTAVNQAAFERQIDGIVYGDSREQGIVRGRDFVHPILRFALSFPQGWEIANSAEQVSAREREDSSVGIVLELAESSGSLQQTAIDEMTRAGLRPASGENTQINGLPAFLGVYQGTINNTQVVVRGAHIRTQQQTYLIAGVATPDEFQRVDPAFLGTIRSFHTISAQEAERIQPNRLDFYTVRPGDTWESLVRSVSPGVRDASTLAIMNGSSSSTPPRAGDRIRIVVAG